MDQVSGFVGDFSEFKDFVFNPYGGLSHYYKKDPETILIGNIITHFIYVLMESNSLTTGYLSKKNTITSYKYLRGFLIV